jgi:hypothetical protein
MPSKSPVIRGRAAKPLHALPLHALPLHALLRVR